MRNQFAAALLATASLAAPALAEDQVTLGNKWTAADNCVINLPIQAITAGASGITLAGNDLVNLKKACEDKTHSKTIMTKGMTKLSMSVK